MPKALRTVVDRDLPPLQVAERRLADLSRQRRNRLVAAVVLALLAVAVGLAYPQIGIALAVGAIAALVAATAALSQRRALLGNLIPMREAYRIEPVSRAGRRFASRGRRQRLAESLRAAVRDAEDGRPHTAYTVAPLGERVLERRGRLLALGDALDGGEADLHPAGVVIVHRLLTRPGHSPLYNPDLEESRLDDLLHRAEACRGGQITP
jgi:hypothetical protein